MHVYLLVLESLLVLSTTVLCEFHDIRPDVTFGDHNDRFDVSDLVSYQNQYFRSDGSIDYRRRHRPKTLKFRSRDSNDEKWLIGNPAKRNKFVQMIRKETQEQLNKLANIILLRMNSRRFGEAPGANVDENLEKFKSDIFEGLNGNRDIPKIEFKYRRVDSVPDNFNYAFPIDMQVEGYLQPLENQVNQ